MRLAPIAVFAGLLLVWGYSWVLLKLALLDAGPVNFAAQRTFIGALALLAMLPLMRRPFWPTRVRETLLLGIVQTTIFVTLSQLSLVDGGAGRSAVLVFTMPFWTLLFAAIVLGERIATAQRWAVALGRGARGLRSCGHARTVATRRLGAKQDDRHCRRCYLGRERGYREADSAARTGGRDLADGMADVFRFLDSHVARIQR